MSTLNVINKAVSSDSFIYKWCLKYDMLLDVQDPCSSLQWMNEWMTKGNFSDMFYDYFITYESDSEYILIWQVTFRKRNSDLVNIQCLLFAREYAYALSTNFCHFCQSQQPSLFLSNSTFIWTHLVLLLIFYSNCGRFFKEWWVG